MYPPTHFIVGLTLGQIGVQLNLFNPAEAWSIAVLATLIDLDHLLYYSIKKRRLSLRQAWNAAVEGKAKGERTALHHLSGLLIFSVFILGLCLIFPKWALALSTAYYPHYLLDQTPLFMKKNWLAKLGGFEMQINLQEVIFTSVCLLIICLLIIL